MNILPRDKQIEAIRRLAASGMSPYSIASAAGIAIEQVRAIIGKPVRCENCDE